MSTQSAASHTHDDRYARLFETATDGILLFDAVTLNAIDANAQMEELIGLPRDDIVGMHFDELGIFGAKPATDFIETLKLDGYAHRDRLTMKGRNGETHDVEIVGSVFDVAGRSVLHCNVRDISERSHRERIVRRHAVALAEGLRQKDEFLAMLSHELRNPLAPILNAVLLLHRQSENDPELHDTSGVLERQVGQLKRLVDDLLEVSRINTGTFTLRRARIAMGSVVERAIEASRTLIDGRAHRLAMGITTQPVYLYGDPARLEQVIVNLLNNAAKYTPDGGLITITMNQVQDQCVIRVRDEGVGIAPEALPHIFDLFVREKHAHERSHDGLGIGLSLVRRLVELHGGRVDVQSTVGKGSEFTIWLPVHEPAGAGGSIPPADDTPANGALHRVLVVEDNLDAARTVTILLEQCGHTVATVHDGNGALSRAKEFEPTAVLLDIGLPGIDGFQVAQLIRRELGNVLLIAVTGYGHDVDRRRSREVGFDHHLVKPVEFKVLQRILAGTARRS